MLFAELLKLKLLKRGINKIASCSDEGTGDHFSETLYTRYWDIILMMCSLQTWMQLWNGPYWTCFAMATSTCTLWLVINSLQNNLVEFALNIWSKTYLVVMYVDYACMYTNCHFHYFAHEKNVTKLRTRILHLVLGTAWVLNKTKLSICSQSLRNVLHDWFFKLE